MDNMNFLKTTDKETYEMLMSEGFVLLNEQDGVWTFLNEPTVPKMNFDKKKFVYSNQLFI